jgi:nucleoside-diphosphate-sugar epimerase
VRILVTGSEGYIGRILVGFLDPVHQVVRCDLGLFMESARTPSNALDYMDIRQLSQSSFDGVDAVVHLAALSNDPMGELDAKLTRSINVDGTAHVARLAAGAGVSRFIFMSSCSVYGFQSANDPPALENTETRPLTEYARSKLLGERSLVPFLGNMSVVMLRAGTAFGSSPNMRLDLVLNDFVWTAWRHGTVRLSSLGQSYRPLVAARDIARILLHFVELPPDELPEGPINVGSEKETYQVIRLAEIVAGLMGVPLVIADHASADHRDYRVGFDRLSKTLPATFKFETVEAAVDELSTVFTMAPDFYAQRERFVRLQQLTARLPQLMAFQ